MKLGIIAAGLLGAVVLAAAQPLSKAEDSMSHDDHGAAQTSGAAAAFAAANAKMHKDMAIDYSGMADVDFVKSMIPHHQGAIDMARVELQYGSDPELKKLAEEIIAAQESEIAAMQAWLKKNGP